MSKHKLSDESIDMILGQVDMIMRRFKELSTEASVILAPDSMPQAEMQLKDVLKSTEEATTRILEQATALSMAVQEGGASPALQEKVQAHVFTIYEACSFQDLTGQRIKKVLIQINEIGLYLKRISDIAQLRGDAGPIISKKDPLLNGPQFAKDAPSQNEIDNMFKS